MPGSSADVMVFEALVRHASGEVHPLRVDVREVYAYPGALYHEYTLSTDTAPGGGWVKVRSRQWALADLDGEMMAGVLFLIAAHYKDKATAGGPVHVCACIRMDG